ncbi:hypothetical protein HOF65_03640 [bacterium]|nr:hypothetical protein [bacterium]MBT3853071.1 hypothetical protein [bacterium]MBT4633330.1 hypothetical protein [bacterium]MBT6779252.1 hypothetical protein [bacterium]
MLTINVIPPGISHLNGLPFLVVILSFNVSVSHTFTFQPLFTKSRDIL